MLREREESDSSPEAKYIYVSRSSTQTLNIFIVIAEYTDYRSPCSMPSLNVNGTKKKVVGFVDQMSPERYQNKSVNTHICINMSIEVDHWGNV